MNFGNDVKAIRMHLLYSQEAFAKCLNVSFATVNRWETGHCRPSLRALSQLEVFCKSRNIPFDAQKYADEVLK